MTLKRLKIHIATGLLAVSCTAVAADTPEPRIAAAQAAIDRAAGLPMGGPSAEMLAEARRRLALANEALAARRKRQALQHADEAEAAAELAAARFRYNRLRFEVESRTSRNTELRRRLLIQPAGPAR